MNIVRVTRLLVAAAVQAAMPQASRLDNMMICAVGGLLYGVASLALIYFLIADAGEKEFVSTRLGRARQLIFARGLAR